MVRIILTSLVLVASLTGCWGLGFGTPSPNKWPLRVFEADDYLRNHSQIFIPRRVINVGEDIYSAIGYALANMIMINGPDGIVIIDTTETMIDSWTAYEDLRNEIDDWTKPLVAIILTHFHTGVFKLYASRRGTRQFGDALVLGEELLNAGIGLESKHNDTIVNDTLVPTDTYRDNTTVQLAGLEFELMRTKGETDDQTSIWIPSKRALFCGDNLYEAFPNLYAIRGNPNRYAKAWYESLDKVRALGAEYLIPSHTEPVIGAAKIDALFTNYRNGIKFVFDQTIRYMNLNYEPDDIVMQVKLPPALAYHPYLLEFYGSVDWSIRSIYQGLIGWFDGDAASLNPLTKKQRAHKIMNIATLPAMYESAKASYDRSNAHLASSGFPINEELQWALELTTMILDTKRTENDLYPVARQLKIDVLRALAVSQISATGRNFYFTVALEMEQNINSFYGADYIKQTLLLSTADQLLPQYALRFNAEACDPTAPMSVVLSFTDINRKYKIKIRNCVANLISEDLTSHSECDVTASMTWVLWRSIVVGDETIIESYGKGEIYLDGDEPWWKLLATLEKFLSLMDRSDFLTAQ
uniref:alkyl/aryl-sulfatase BDS1-like isoform X2 n=1 Tax=Ciona intestinalis TaxID=7719 RepID=UPI000EF4BAB5|nr:alkyl/aryl-sulfatase BDS1-like isoform X2 [Ciona intestinalis]|eukprot:XP_026692960.1 alkyl/aryl-sulfatase BDS1-like isoform X2 [Ciona intestinalis]